MQWYGILALLFLLFVLAGFVYIGANTDKLGFGFGEPNYISKNMDASNYLDSIPSSSLSFDFPSFSSSEYMSKGNLDLDKIEREIRQEISQAQSYEDITQIMNDMAIEILDNPQVEKECKQVLIDLDKEQEKLTVWTENGKDIYSFPIEKTQQLYKQWAFCSAGFQLGVYELSEWKELKGILEN